MWVEDSRVPEIRNRISGFGMPTMQPLRVLLPLWACLAAARAPRPWLDATLPVDERVELLASVMTLDEKLAQLLSAHVHRNTSDIQSLWGDTGFGVACIPFYKPANKAYTRQDCLDWRNKLQVDNMRSSRLGIPISFRGELLHSGALPDSVVFPMPCSLGATWNRTLARAVASESAADARDGGIDYGFGPVLQVRREDEGRFVGRRKKVMSTLSSLVVGVL